MKAVKVAENIYWVGAIDWNIRNFHGYLTQRGSTYNAYLIVDEKITLIDTVKSCFFDEMIGRISSIIDPSKIDMIISNHVEMDHSGGLPRIMEIARNAQLVTSSPNGKKGLIAHYKKDWSAKTVNSGDSLSTGSRTLEFIATPMIHWPDNIVTFCPEEKLLFSNDAFGQHIASSERFDNEMPLDLTIEEAKKYYANIVLPFGKQVSGALSIIDNLNINIIAPSHGLIWKKHIPVITGEYRKWASSITDNKAVIIYDSMWESTKKIALSIQNAFDQKDIKTRLIDLKNDHISDIMTEVIEARYICVGSPTLNNNMLPAVSAFLTYMKGLAPKKRTGLAFGSYGWGGQSIQQIEDILKSCKFDLFESIKINYVPDNKQLIDIKNKLEEVL
ncbi:MAG: FprA family A-type flavoprotein [bacterium]|nr:FprA family A-type flavoprotein [bacterium]